MRLAPLYRNALLLTGLLLSGIVAVQAADWPRQITDSRGTHTLESQPQRIVSTSVTLTDLYAISRSLFRDVEFKSPRVAHHSPPFSPVPYASERRFSSASLKLTEERDSPDADCTSALAVTAGTLADRASNTSTTACIR